MTPFFWALLAVGAGGMIVASASLMLGPWGIAFGYGFGILVGRITVFAYDSYKGRETVE